MPKVWLLGAALLLVAAGTAVFWASLLFPLPVEAPVLEMQQAPATIQERKPAPKQREQEEQAIQGRVRHDVPFTPQAPLAEWWDPRQQYGCEESLAVMAMRWVEGRELTPQEAREEILQIADFQQERYGVFEDTSVADTATRIFQDYYAYPYVEVRKGISPKDIKEELYQGNVVLVPINGRTVGNPHFVAPGPLRHMIMVVGYDSAEKVFITNDPGTKNGEGYRYAEEVLASSLQNYDTGLNEPIQPGPPDMLVVKKGS